MVVLLRGPCSVVDARNGAVRVVNVCPAPTKAGPCRQADIVTHVDSLQERISGGIHAYGRDCLRGAHRIWGRTARRNLAQQYFRSMLKSVSLRTVIHNVHNVRGGVCTNPGLELVLNCSVYVGHCPRLAVVVGSGHPKISICAYVGERYSWVGD